jgi:hypothetical protein
MPERFKKRWNVRIDFQHAGTNVIKRISGENVLVVVKKLRSPVIEVKVIVSTRVSIYADKSTVY